MTYESACVYYAIPMSAYTHVNIHADCQTCILKHTHYYICVYQAIHIAIFPPFIENRRLYRRGIPEEKAAGIYTFCYNVGVHVSFVYIKLYAFCFYCVYNTIRDSERMRGRTRGVSRNGRSGVRILCILSYTRFIMIVYIMLYIYGLYRARKGVCTRLCILRHTHLHAVDLSCV